LIGDGDQPGDREILELRARELGVCGKVEITGFLDRSEALVRLATADVGISPFFPNRILEVASPTKLVEYMALGLPVVANNQLEQQLVLRESHAGVCTPWGARHFARAVRWLIARSDAERAAMGARGRAWIEAHRTYETIADDFERGYFFAIEGGGVSSASIK
jgi:glycosyltransferase involved in cell wall biosynthesis